MGRGGGGGGKGTPLTMVYLSVGEQRPKTRRSAQTSRKRFLSMLPSSLNTRFLNSGPSSTDLPC